jgi:hypothetical protein
MVPAMRGLAMVIVIAACSGGKRPTVSRDAATTTWDAIAVAAIDAGVDAVPPAVTAGGLDLEAELAKLEARRAKANQPVEAVPLAYIAEIEGGELVKVDAVPASPVRWGEQILGLLPRDRGVLYAIGSLMTGEQAPGHGVIYRRTGATWKLTYQARNRPVVDIDVDPGKGRAIHAIGGRGLFLRLAGTKWVDVEPPPDVEKIGVIAADDDGLWIGGESKAGYGVVYERVDGAWTGGTVVDGDWILAIGVNGKDVWAGGGEAGGVYKRVDARTWKRDAAFPREQIRSFVFRGDVVWTAGEVLRRRDPDGTWHAVDTGLGEQHTQVIDGPDDTLVVATMGGVLIGDPTGSTWSLVPIPYVVGAIARQDKRIFVAFTVER